MSKELAPVVFPEHFGFCEGVKAADSLLRDVADMGRELGIDKIYGYHGIVHNDQVIKEHVANGVQFVDDISEIPDNSVVVTSAHGVGPEVVYELEQKGATVFEAACPLVLQTHRAVQKARKEREKVIYVCKGKPGYVKKLHDEVEGVVGHLDYTYQNGVLFADALDRSYIELTDEVTDSVLSGNEKYRIVTQTTLDADKCLAFRARIADYITSRQPGALVSESTVGDVCRAVTNRQKSVAELVDMQPERIVVATDLGSKNGMGYVALAQAMVDKTGQMTSVHNVATAEEAKLLPKISGVTGLTASASTPDTTTFAIAEELGAGELPQIDRKAFKLRDGSMEVIFEKLFRHAQRLSGAEA
jgi:4-hydroxy-3-methylbut-2-enyl diphosphate reductase